MLFVSNFSRNSAVKSFLLIGLFFVLVFLVKPVRAQGASLTFSPESIEVSTGESFEVDIVVDTAGEKVGGVGADILFNTNDLIAEKIETTSMFVDYPLASIDNSNGKVSISGIVSSMNNLYAGKDVFATVTFRAKSPGTGTVNFDFTPGDTTDSNIAVTYGTGDILSTTNYLTVHIGGG